MTIARLLLPKSLLSLTVLLAVPLSLTVVAPCFALESGSAPATQQAIFASGQLAQAAKLRDQGDFTGAIALYKTLLETAPNDTLLQKELAVAYAYNQEYSKSISLLQTLLKTEPS
ncbi:MAG: tetratricopeptide repeat protein, partial [Kovacikia sp.]